MSDYHEPERLLDEKTKDITRILQSLKEEIEAVNWYNQRAAATDDEEVEAIVLHNRDEEIEHAAMAIEWLRREIPAFNEELETYLFTELPITEVEEAAESEGDSEESSSGDLGLGDMK
ncbi:MAG: encapsulin-associated ferritin-like protein [Bacillota bacterium]